ncbi:MULTISPECIES: hypothetical protein [Bacillus]|uniref:hypothetical protein n=1 Tax=Bacillus TaxID=1386 RepID=UPI000779F583|nr:MULTISPECIES: hypothetical protein [Bacillus cereus group]KXY86094.1 hypothetical protein AT270_29950 [Bacillus cereus]MBG9937331.1 hypothetical protein [Bacillus tropicus]MED2996968.1 hypothetical protein [Bacillus tropicus]OTY57409.1 hypothetical protein BK748_14285 [Bacillus thuringiensis serovar graciosensis]
MATVKNGKQVLELSHWDASLSQSVKIEKFEEDKKYKLHVRGNVEMEKGQLRLNIVKRFRNDEI